MPPHTTEDAMATASDSTAGNPGKCPPPPYGIGGLGKHGALFGPGTVPDWVDLKQAPGFTDQREQLGLPMTLRTVVSLKFFFLSPNLMWFLMALASHLIVPYDIDGAAAREGAAGAAAWVSSRLLLNFSIAFAYYSFFYLGLYHFNWGGRKFKPGSYPTLANMAHNLWYWGLGILQWTFLEYVMCRVWAGGLAAGYATNEEILNSPKLLVLNVFWVLATPVWRDVHFYIAHRFVHIRAVYKFVHSLHHRNDDPEPFSGLTMHPVEHLYYFANAFTPALYLGGLSPLIFLWTFMHLSIAPGAGHSGWEDHWQADQYHYVHHAKFECNYGSPMSAFIDQYFGTFREKLGESKVYQGEWKKATDNAVNSSEEKGHIGSGVLAAEGRPAGGKAAKNGQPVWSRQGVLGLPADAAHAVYTAFWVYLFGLVYWGVAHNHTDDGALVTPVVAGIPTPLFVAVQTAYGPVVLALALCKVFRDRVNWRWPFQKEPVFGAFGLFVMLGWLACINPIFGAILGACSPPAATA